jgi:Lon protease-like protein
VGERLALFPLGAVLYPGLVLPLHIFEDRYRRLVRDLIALPEDRPRRFGVVAIREGREVGADGVRALHDVGCTAGLHQVEAYDDGRFDIVTAGVTRFRLRRLDTSLPYLTADVDFLDEPDGEGADVLARSLIERFAAYRRLLGEPPGAPGPELPDNARVLSYLVASAVVLDLPDKQRLLAAPDTATRLRFELELLRREISVLQRLPSLPAVDLVRAGFALS